MRLSKKSAPSFLKDTSMKVGCDIVYIPRFKKVIGRTPGIRRRIFLPEEEKDASPEHLAGIFAAKEATMKAIGIPAGRWHDIEIDYYESGRPKIKLVGNSVSKYTCDLSIAHDGDYAVAYVVFLP